MRSNAKIRKPLALTFSSEFTGSATYGETYSIPNYTFEDKSEIKERTMAAYDTVTGEELPFINSTTLNVTTKNDIEFRFYAKDIYDNETKYSKTIIVMSFYNDEALKGTNVLSEFSNVDEYPTLVQSAGGYIGNRGSHRIAMKESIEDADVQAGIDDGDGGPGIVEGGRSFGRSEQMAFLFRSVCKRRRPCADRRFPQYRRL